MSVGGPGGFIPYSPPPPSVASSNATHSLPHPRSTPLRPGKSKEASFIRYVDQQILHIQRRFAKRDAALTRTVKETDEEGRVIQEAGDPTTKAHLEQSEEWRVVQGYANFAEAARDIEELTGVVWVSGTPALQVPYLISIALLTHTMITAFPANPRQLFRLLNKLDHAFASLLQGRDIETEEFLPGFGTGYKVSTTEKVRIKSLIQRTRIAATNAMAQGEFQDDEQESMADTEDEDMDGDLVMDEDDDDHLQNEESWDMQVAKVYDKTLVEIGDSMDGPSIGIRTEPVR